MKKLLWLSRHTPLPVQKAAAQKLGFTEIVHDPRSFGDYREVARRIKSSGCDDVVIVAPLSLLQLLVEREGIRPLWAEMVEVGNGPADLEYGGKRYRFAGYKRVVGVKLILEDVA